MNRLDKRVAHLAGLSRRDATAAVKRGRITVDGDEERDPRRQVPDDARLTLDGEPLEAPPGVVLWHKPAGIQCTVGDGLGRPNLASHAAELLELGLHPVGRLDADTSGLLVWAADGRITQHLLHPKRGIPRVYVARVENPPGPELIGRLRDGVETAEGTFTAEVHAVDGDLVTLAVTEGKHRMVRRMLANAGHPVLDLRRLSYGPFQLADLPSGAWRPATDDELEQLGLQGGRS